MPNGSESASAALAQGMSQRWHRDSYTYQLMLSPVQSSDTGDEVEVEETEIRLDKLIYLLLRKFRIAIEILVGIVDEIENLLSHSALENILLGKLADMQIVTFLYHHRNLGVLLRHLIRHHDLELHVLVIYLKTLQGLDVLRIVRVIVDGRHGTELVEIPRRAFPQGPYR